MRSYVKGDAFMNEPKVFHKKLIMMVLAGVLISSLSLSASTGLTQASEEEETIERVLEIEDPSTGQSDNGEYHAAEPGQATLISPTGSIDNKNPTYIWNKDDDSLYYLLEVSNLSGVVIEQWYNADDVTSGSTCSATPSVALFSGKYTWKIETWNCEDYGPWSEDMSFSVCATTTKPGRASPISPKGTIGTFNPTFYWNPVADSSRYFLKVNGPGGYSFNEWFEAEEVTADTICLLVSPDELAPGDYTWQIRTGNCIGDGPWSAVMRFKVTDKAPAKASAITPKGLVSTRTPIFTWSAVPGSTQYHLEVENDDSETIIDEWFLAEEVTYGYRCSAISSMILPDDDVDYFWRVQASNDVGDGLWSSFKYFETVCGMPGIVTEQKGKEQKDKEQKGKEQKGKEQIGKGQKSKVSAKDDREGCGCEGNQPSSKSDR
jgi:hypothetical protein